LPEERRPFVSEPEEAFLRQRPPRPGTIPMLQQFNRGAPVLTLGEPFTPGEVCSIDRGPLGPTRRTLPEPCVNERVSGVPACQR
jgi:hypothetical protein